MFFLFFAVGVALAMFAGSLALMEYGRRMGLRRLAEEGNAAMAGLNAVEGAVFALMGLLLAFTLSGHSSDLTNDEHLSCKRLTI